MKFLAAILLLLSITAAAVLFLLENPDRFKTQLTLAVESTTGYEVTVGGELSWRYWPPIAINAEQVQLATPGEPPFIKFEQVSIDIDLIPLIAQRRIVDINEITVTGGQVTLLVDAQGRGNWQLPDTGSAQPTASDSGSSDIALTSTLQRFRVHDLTISYVDQQENANYDITLAKLITSALTADRPFDISLIARVQDNLENLNASIESTGQLQYQQSSDQFNFDDLVTTLTLVIDDERYPEISLTSKGQFRPSQDAIVLNQNDIRVSSANIASSGVVNLGGATPRFDGVMNLQTADPARLARDFDIALPVGFLQFTADIAVNPSQFHMRTVEGEFDQSKFKGTATYELSPVEAVTVDIRIDSLDLATYLTSSPANNSTGAAGVSSLSAVPEDSELIPLETLRGTQIKAIVRIDSLISEGGTLSNVKVELGNNGKVIDLIANASGYDGKIVLTAKTHLAQEVRTELNLTLDRLDIIKLIDVEGVTGSFTVNSDLSFTGTMMSELDSSLTGRSTFTVKDGTLDVRPLKSVATTIDALMGKTSAMSQWPDIIPFDSMAGDHVFTNGIASGQVFNASLENLSVTALGGIDLPAETLDFDVTAMLRKTEQGKFKVSEQLAGIRWPLSCAGKLSESPADLCLGKDGAISQLVAEIIRQDLERRGKSKVEELISEKLPEEYKDITTDLFKNLFKKK